MKKYLLPILIVVIIIQLFIPAYMIYNKYDILKTGQEVKFKVAPIDPYDAFRGRYVWLNVEGGFTSKSGKYGSIVIDKDGFAKVDKITNEKPKSGLYINSKNKKTFVIPIDRYYMDEKLAPRAEEITRQRGTGKSAYVTARIKNGNLVVAGLFIDGVSIEDMVKNEIK